MLALKPYVVCCRVLTDTFQSLTLTHQYWIIKMNFYSSKAGFCTRFWSIYKIIELHLISIWIIIVYSHFKKIVIVWIDLLIKITIEIEVDYLSSLAFWVNWYVWCIFSQKPIILHTCTTHRKNKTKLKTWFYFCYQPCFIKGFHNILVCLILIL